VDVFFTEGCRGGGWRVAAGAGVSRRGIGACSVYSYRSDRYL
jgi:hypothetical protein